METTPPTVANRPPTSLIASIGFRFSVAIIAFTAIAVGRVELERQRLIAERNALEIANRRGVATDRLSRSEVELARLSAPGALLTAGLQPTDQTPQSMESE